MDTAANGNIPVFIDTTTPNTKILLTINMSNVTKLTSANYLMWSLQIHALLDGYDLAGYLDGSIAVPPPTLTTDDQISVNPEFTIWKRQDRLIYSSHWSDLTFPSATSLSSNNNTRSLGHARLHLCETKSWTHQAIENSAQNLEKGN